MQDTKVLVIDDDPKLLDIVEAFLSQAGATVYLASNGLEGLRQFYIHTPHLVLLDLMMPDIDGREICRYLRQISEVPIIMLTALDQENDMVEGFAAGADDYITKPFNSKILLTRCQTVLRRATSFPAAEGPPTYIDDYLIIDLGKYRVLVKGKTVKLTATEHRLLAYLVEHANQVLTFNQILQAVWGEEYLGYTAYVHVYIGRLREKLEADTRDPSYIKTELGVGYQFEKHSPGQPTPS